MDASSKSGLKTLLKGLVFVMPFLIAGVVMESGLKKVVNTYNSTRAQTDAAAATCEVLILGSSNAAWGLAPAAFSVPAVNLANIMQSLYYDLALAERYLPRMPRLKLVILPLTYVTMKNEIYDWEDSSRAYYYAQFWDIPPQDRRLFDSQRWSLTALYGVRMAISYARRSFDVNNIVTFESETTAKAAATRDEEARKRAAELDGVIHEERLGDNMARLDRLATMVEQRGATLVLLEMPTQDVLLRRLSSTHLEAGARASQELIKRHPRVRYVDHLRDSRVPLEDFLNVDHLNPRGATNFTKLVEGELIHPQVAQP